MGKVLGYIVGALILFGIGVFIIYQFASFIKWIRDRLHNKKLPEVKPAQTREEPDEEPRKGGDQTE